MNSTLQTILLIEDEPLVRDGVAELLEDLGFTVSTAATARETTRLLQQPDPRYRAVIIDLGLPDRSGTELAKDILAQLGGIPVIIASGSDRGDLDDVLANDVRVGFLAKPFGIRKIAEVFAGFGIASQERSSR